MSKIEIRNLDLFIKQQQILKDINVEIPENKVTVILGPSGCGKTTLLKCLNRLTDLIEDVKVTGDIIVGGDNIFKTKKDITEIRKINPLDNLDYIWF